MTDNKQYPELPEPTAWRTYDNLLKRARYNAMPITSMQPGIYSHTRMFTEDQMYAYVDADRAMRAAQAAPAAPASRDAEDALVAALERAYFWMDAQADTQSKGCHATFDLMMLREERDAARAAIDAARAKQEGK